MRKKLFKKLMMLGLTVCMSAMLISCDDEKKGKEEETEKTKEYVRKENTEGAKTPSRCFGDSERSIWYYIKSETEDDMKQSVDEDAIIDSIYVLENGNVTIYELDYMEFALDNKLGDLEMMSDDEIIQLLCDEKQSHYLKYMDIKERDLAVSVDAAKQGTLDVFEERYDLEGKLERFVTHSGMSSQYWDYISLLYLIDLEAYNKCSYKLDVTTDESLNYTVKEDVSFKYDGAKTLPRLEGVTLEYDENGNVVVIYDDEKKQDVKFIESEFDTGRQFTFIESKGATEIGYSYYGGFVVENLYNYGVTVENGWFVTRTEEDAKFELDAVETKGVTINGLE